jgi:hypothetical protein
VVEAVRAQDRIRAQGRDADGRDEPICWVGVGVELETGSRSLFGGSSAFP